MGSRSSRNCRFRGVSWGDVEAGDRDRDTRRISLCSDDVVDRFGDFLRIYSDLWYDKVSFGGLGKRRRTTNGRSACVSGTDADLFIDLTFLRPTSGPIHYGGSIREAIEPSLIIPRTGAGSVPVLRHTELPPGMDGPR